MEWGGRGVGERSFRLTRDCIYSRTDLFSESWHVSCDTWESLKYNIYLINEFDSKRHVLSTLMVLVGVHNIWVGLTHILPTLILQNKSITPNPIA